MTETSRPGGRPRTSRAPDSAFAAWLRTCGRKPSAVASELKVTESAVYNLRNGYFKPGLELALRIEELTRTGKNGKLLRTPAVPAASWAKFVARPRPSKRSKAA